MTSYLDKAKNLVGKVSALNNPPNKTLQSESPAMPLGEAGLTMAERLDRISREITDMKEKEAIAFREINKILGEMKNKLR